jgi:hypothetical protein
MQLMLAAAAALLEPLEATEAQGLTVCWTTLSAVPVAVLEAVLT